MTVSVIIPTLNEENCVAETIHSVRAQAPHEVIVADGGSTDATRTAAAGADLFLEAPCGRARQMNAGAARASGDVLLFLHADCTLEPGALNDAERRLRRGGVVAGGYTMTGRAARPLFPCIDACATAPVRPTRMAYRGPGPFLRRPSFGPPR